MENTEEIWKDIIGCEGHYQVSNIGNIRSLKSKNNECYILLKLKNKEGYKRAIVWINGKGRNIPAHRAVAIAFIPNPLNKPQVNHINGIKHDNRVENLEWCTNAENIAHAVNTGLNRKGEQINFSKLTKDKVLKIREMAKQGIKIKEIVKEIGVVGYSSIWDILSRRTWKHI